MAITTLPHLVFRWEGEGKGLEGFIGASSLVAPILLRIFTVLAVPAAQLEEAQVEVRHRG